MIYVNYNYVYILIHAAEVNNYLQANNNSYRSKESSEYSSSYVISCLKIPSFYLASYHSEDAGL